MSACPAAKKTKMRESETGDKYKKGDRIFAKLKGYPIWPAQIAIMFYIHFASAVMKPEMMWPFNSQTVAKYSKSSSPQSFKDAMKEIKANLDLVQHSAERTTLLESAAALSPVPVPAPAPVASVMSPEPSSASTSSYTTIPITDEIPPVCPSGSAVNSNSYIEDTNFGVDFEDRLCKGDDASFASSNLNSALLNELEQNTWNSSDLGFGRLVGSQNQSQGQISSPFPAPFPASGRHLVDYGQSRSTYYDWGNYGGPAPPQSHPFPHFPFSLPPYYNNYNYNPNVASYGPPRLGYPYHPQYENQQPPYWSPRHPLPPYARPPLRPQHAPQAPQPLTDQASPPATTGASNATVQSRMKIDPNAKMSTSLASATTTTSSLSEPVGPKMLLLLTKVNPAVNSTPLITNSTEAACAQQTTEGSPEEEIDLGFGGASSVSSLSRRRGIERLFDDVNRNTDGIPTTDYRCIVQNCEQEYSTKEYHQILEHICKKHLKTGSQNRYIYVHENAGDSNRSQTMCNFQGCEFKKKSRPNVARHTNEHLRKSVDCTVGRCSKQFLYTNQMQQHVQKDHSVTPR